MFRISSRAVTILFMLCLSLQNSECDKIYVIKNSWDTGFQGEIHIPIKQTTQYGWTFQIKFHKPIERFECWAGELQTAEQGESGNQYTYTNFKYNKILEAGTTFKVEFTGAFIGKTGPKVPPVTIKFGSEIIYSDHFTFNNAAATVSTTDIVYILNSLTERSSLTEVPYQSQTPTRRPIINNIENDNVVNNNPNPNNNINNNDENLDINQRNEINNKNNEIANNNINSPESNMDQGSSNEDFDTEETDEGSGGYLIPTTLSPGRRPVRPTRYPYIRAIQKSLLFYEAQRSGPLPSDNRIPWRSDSALGDRGENDEDLTGGYYDAGDHIKFGYPMAFSMTTLAWGVIEYWEAYQQAGELENAIKALKWGVDYIIKAHVGKYEFYGQVGLGEKDHKYWGRPEDMFMERPAFKVTKNNPGSDLVAESSAALSAASLAFERSGIRPYALPAYIKKVRYHAEVLYDFANTYRGQYHKAIKDAVEYYKSTDYEDEITWSVVWLYRATGKTKYLQEAEGKYQNWGQFMLPIEYLFSWDDKTVGIQLLLSQVTKGPKQENYLGSVKAYCKEMRENKSRYTPKGLLFMSEWSPLRYAANIAFICLMASDQGLDSVANFAFAQKQIHYMLGDTGRSYVVGYGRRYPQQPHHRSSSCPANYNSCSWNSYSSPKPNPNVLHGALVGGPNKKDVFEDLRKNFRNTEVTLDHNSCFQGAVAGLLQRSIIGLTRPYNRTHEPWYVHVTTTTTTTISTTPTRGAAPSTLHLTASNIFWTTYISIKLMFHL